MTIRSFMRSPEATLTTIYGEIRATVNGRGYHVYTETTDRPSRSTGEGLAFRDARYSGSVRFTIDEEGTVSAAPTDFYMHKAGAYGKDVAPTYRAKLAGAIRDAVAAWLAENPDVRREAVRASANNDLLSAETELAKAQAVVADLNEQIAALRATLAPWEGRADA